MDLDEPCVDLDDDGPPEEQDYRQTMQVRDNIKSADTTGDEIQLTAECEKEYADIEFEDFHSEEENCHQEQVNRDVVIPNQALDAVGKEVPHSQQKEKGRMPQKQKKGQQRQMKLEKKCHKQKEVPKKIKQEMPQPKRAAGKPQPKKKGQAVHASMNSSNDGLTLQKGQKRDIRGAKKEMKSEVSHVRGPKKEIKNEVDHARPVVKKEKKSEDCQLRPVASGWDVRRTRAGSMPRKRAKAKAKHAASTSGRKLAPQVAQRGAPLKSNHRVHPNGAVGPRSGREVKVENHINDGAAPSFEREGTSKSNIEGAAGPSFGNEAALRSQRCRLACVPPPVALALPPSRPPRLPRPRPRPPPKTRRPHLASKKNTKNVPPHSARPCPRPSPKKAPSRPAAPAPPRHCAPPVAISPPGVAQKIKARFNQPLNQKAAEAHARRAHDLLTAKQKEPEDVVEPRDVEEPKKMRTPGVYWNVRDRRWMVRWFDGPHRRCKSFRPENDSPEGIEHARRSAEEHRNSIRGSHDGHSGKMAEEDPHKAKGLKLEQAS